MKVLLDSRSPVTYLTDEVKDFLKLNEFSKQNGTIKTFGSNNGQSKELGKLQFVLKDLLGKNLRLYRSSFGLPVVCNSIKDNRVDLMKKDSILRDLQLFDQGFHCGKIDFLIGADHYYSHMVDCN